MPPIVLKTKYAFHSLLWLLGPDLVLDIGSMDGADSKRFRTLLKKSDIVAFEANPDNFGLMIADATIRQNDIRVLNRLVSPNEGTQSFFIQRPDGEQHSTNRGTSSVLARTEPGMRNEEVHVGAVRVDNFLAQEYSQATKAALWIDVEGFAYEVLESMRNASDRIQLIHVEVETQPCWPGQRLEPDVVQILESMDYIVLAHGRNAIQRDLLLVSRAWYNSDARKKIERMLHIARWAGPTLSRSLSVFPS